MSPLSRNQVTPLQKDRPPSPHSSSEWMVSRRRHRAATKPTTVTRAKTPAKTPNWTWWLAKVGMSGPLPGEGVDQRDDQRGEARQGELEPVEERDAQQRRLDPVVERHQQR